MKLLTTKDAKPCPFCGNENIADKDIQDVIEAFVKDGDNDHGDNDVYEFLDRHGINWK